MPEPICMQIVAAIIFFCLGFALFVDGNKQFLAAGRPADGGPPELRGQGCTALLLIFAACLWLVGLTPWVFFR